MSFDAWLAFTTTYAIVSLLPGPSTFMVVARSISKGFYPAFLCILGDVLGGLVVLTLSYAGVGAILAASHEAFLAVKWMGVAYMAWLGIAAFRESARPFETEKRLPELGKVRRESIRIGFLTGVLNPKAILFYVAFLSQFIDPEREPVLQYIVLGLSASVVVIIVLSGYALIAARARALFTRAVVRRRMSFLSGLLFTGASCWMAIAR